MISVNNNSLLYKQNPSDNLRLTNSEAPRITIQTQELPINKPFLVNGPEQLPKTPQFDKFTPKSRSLVISGEKFDKEDVNKFVFTFPLRKAIDYIPYDMQRPCNLYPTHLEIIISLARWIWLDDYNLEDICNINELRVLVYTWNLFGQVNDFISMFS